MTTAVQAAAPLTKGVAMFSPLHLDDTLQTLAESLLEHLDYEELSIESTVLRVREAPERIEELSG
jgi:hypothetical protein